MASGLGVADNQAIWQIPSYDLTVFDQVITQLYKRARREHITDLDQRIAFFSEAFLEKPYQLGSLGEGHNALFDQQPIYRTDSFDCLTYVSTVLALSLGHNVDEFRKTLISIQYQHGKVDYFNRNHFTSLDWNINNQKMGYLKDITSLIYNQAGWPIYKTSRTYINKKAWYQKKKIDSLKSLLAITKNMAMRKLEELRAQGQLQNNSYSHINYIPLTELFDRNGNPNFYVFSQFQNGTIIEIVCPDCKLANKIGTNLHVSHLGFVIHTSQGVMFRSASSIKQKVADIPLIDYLRNYLGSRSVKGINLQYPLKPSK